MTPSVQNCRTALVAPRAAQGSPPVLLGRGRSGMVFSATTLSGREVAWKVFVPDRASRWVMAVLTGAENPYRWSRSAVVTALLRRRVLERLVPFWFGDRLRLPRTLGVRRDVERGAWALGAERIQGRHACVAHLGDVGQAGEACDLVQTILRPLQARLREAGFDGLLWQAGLGNPVAASNFLRETGPGARARWVWIDLESGVPALFPLNPWHLLRTYLPLGDKHGHWLFDDVDVPALRGYLARHVEALRAAWPPGTLEAVASEVDEIGVRQRALGALRRHERGLAAHLARGSIDLATARVYAQRPLRWWMRVGAGCARRLAGEARRGVVGLVRALAPRVLVAGRRRWGRFFLSEATRSRWLRGHLHRRLGAWRRRGFLTPQAAQGIGAGRWGERAEGTLADLAGQLAIRRAVRVLGWGLVPACYVTGVLASGGWALLLLVASGALGRTVWTSVRSVAGLRRRRPVPWVALGIGMVPWVGQVAFPLQLLVSGGAGERVLGRFLVRDLLCGLGRGVPIWGGSDSLLEHRANAVATLLLRPWRDV